MNGVIGSENTIPWHHKADMRRFKELTTYHTIVMGRLTYESMGRPLHNRRNIVITSKKIDGVECAEMLSEAIRRSDGLIWLIGGASIYREGMSFAQELDITIVPETISSANVVYFPWINPKLFKINSMVYDQENNLTYIKYAREF